MIATRAEPLLTVDHVSLSFGSKVVLRDVHTNVLNLHRDDFYGVGQVVAFLGPSGIGKTQLLRILAGLQEPTSGNVLVGAKQEPVRAGKVGLVAQNYPLYHNRTVRGNLLVAARQTQDWRTWTRLLARNEANERCKEMLARFGLTDLADRYPQELSGGQRQRVAIAQQLLCSEHLILMDEPTTGLDWANKQKVCKLLAEVANQDDLNTVILVTHDIPTAVAIADTVWLMGRETGIPGARIVQTYDLIELGLCWRPDVQKTQRFADVVNEIQERCSTL